MTRPSSVLCPSCGTLVGVNASIVNDPSHPMYNKATQGTYPTGSTWKIMMATAALEEGVITLKNSKIVCGGGISMGNRFVHCGKNHGMPDIHAAIVHSCDGYFYRLGLKMGVDMIHDWVTRFGMGQRTGVDLPGEVRGTIPSREWKKRVSPRDPEWKDFDTVLASIGQGSVAVPPIQLIRAEAGIVMGGEFHVPHLFKEAKATQLRQVEYFDNKPIALVLELFVEEPPTLIFLPRFDLLQAGLQPRDRGLKALAALSPFYQAKRDYFLSLMKGSRFKPLLPDFGAAAAEAAPADGGKGEWHRKGAGAGTGAGVAVEVALRVTVFVVVPVAVAVLVVVCVTVAVVVDVRVCVSVRVMVAVYVLVPVWVVVEVTVPSP